VPSASLKLPRRKYLSYGHEQAGKWGKLRNEGIIFNKHTFNKE
jgi:hypothetical protein